MSLTRRSRIVAGGDDPDEDRLDALRALRMQYIAETGELERQLIAASQATMGINTLRPDAQQESEKDALRTLRERIQHAIDRRVWYREQSDEFRARGAIRD